MFDEIFVFGHSYETRWIDFESWQYQIATEDLATVLYPDGEKAVSEQARLIDECVFCYVPCNLLRCSEEDIIFYITENLI